MYQKKLGEVTKPGYERMAVFKVFKKNMAKELADHIKTVAAMFHGIGVKKYCELAFKFAQINNSDMPASWTRDKKSRLDQVQAIRKLFGADSFNLT